MNKIAFLALTYDTFQKEELMSRFFSPEQSHLYNLYIHPKTPLPKNSPFQKYVIDPSLHIPTAWGYYSLVQATTIMMKEALKDPSNDKFILISDSHLPTMNMHDMHVNMQLHYSTMSFHIQDARMARHRFYKAFNLGQIKVNEIPISSHHSYFVSQWFVCNRADAEAFVEFEENNRHYFARDKITYVDEIYFAMVASHLGLPWVERTSCFFNWGLNTSNEFIAKGCRKNPHTFSFVSNDFIHAQRDKKILFMRKVHRDTVIENPDFIFSPEYK
jgi:hypothetical protein